MVVGVGHDNVFFHAETEAMRGIELAFSRAKLTKLAPVEHHNSVYDSQTADDSNMAINTSFLF